MAFFDEDDLGGPEAHSPAFFEALLIATGHFDDHEVLQTFLLQSVDSYAHVLLYTNVDTLSILYTPAESMPYEAVLALQADNVLLSSLGLFSNGDLAVAGSANGYHYLIMEGITLTQESSAFYTSLAQQLLTLHSKLPANGKYGFSRGGYIGGLLQQSTYADTAADFFGRQRLIDQAGNALLDGVLPLDIYKMVEQFSIKALPNLIPEEGPVLVHGYLHAGNITCVESSAVAVLTPCLHYGIRELDLAINLALGPIDPVFMHIYQQQYRLQPGFSDRVPIYSLYPLLVLTRQLKTSAYCDRLVQLMKPYV